MNVYEEPVGYDDQCLDVMLQQHFKVSFKPVSLVVGVGENWHVRRLIEPVLDAPQNRRAKGIRNIEEHHSDTVAPFAAKKTRHCIWPVAELFGDFLDAFFCGWRDVPRQWRIVQHNRNRRR